MKRKSGRSVQRVKMMLRRRWQMWVAMDPSRRRRLLHLAGALVLCVVLTGFALSGFGSLGTTLLGTVFVLARGGLRQAWAPAWAETIRRPGMFLRDRGARSCGMTDADGNPALWRSPGIPSGRWARFGRLSGHGALLAGLLGLLVPQPGSIVASVVTGLVCWYLFATASSAHRAGAYKRAAILHPELLKDDRVKAVVPGALALSLLTLVAAPTALLTTGAVTGIVEVTFGVLFSLVLAASVFLYRFGKGYADVDLVWSRYLTSRSSWWSDTIWPVVLTGAAAKFVPPLVSVSTRPDANDPKYEVATFQYPVGATLETYDRFADAMRTSALTTPHLFVAPATVQDAAGRPTSQVVPGQFSVHYAISALGDDAHVKRYHTPLPRRADKAARDAAAAEAEVGRFVYTAALRKAFAGAKLGVPDVVSVEHLYVPDAAEAMFDDRLLVELRVKLPAGVTTDQVVKAQGKLSEQLSAPFFAVGRRVEDGAGGEYVADEVSVVWGENPADLELTGDAQVFVERLGWDDRFRSLKLAGGSGVAPRLVRVERNDDTLTECEFVLPAGVTLEALRAATPKLAEATRAGLLTVTRGVDAGHALVRYLSESPGPEPLRLTFCLEATRRFIVEAVLGGAFGAGKLGVPQLLTLQDLVEPSHEVLVETTWLLPDGVVFGDVMRQHDKVVGAVPLPLVLLGRPRGEEDDSVLTVVFGDRVPGDLDVETGMWLTGLLWDRYFRSCRLVDGAGRTPRLLSQGKTESGLDELVFAVADGLAVEKVKAAHDDLMTAIRMPFVQVEDNADGRTFRVLVGESDPLERMYLFAEWAETILHEPDGSLDLKWAVGVGTDMKPLWDSFDSDLPGLLIAGGSGMGKSVIGASMITQLASKNSPEDLNFWMAEPKNEMQRYKDLPHVKRFVDMATPGENHYAVFADLLEELDDLMEKRYALFGRLPGRPQKLAEARDVLRRAEVLEDRKVLEGSLTAEEEAFLADVRREVPAGTGLPAIVLVCEEVADYFSTPPSALRAERPDWERCVALASKIFRKHRAAGAYGVQMTQYPTKENIPTTIVNQCRRVGLGTNTGMASLVIINEYGLEEIFSPGRGKATVGKGYRDFRGFFFRKPSEKTPDWPDDLEVYLDSLKVQREAEESASSSGRTERFAPAEIPAGIWD